MNNFQLDNPYKIFVIFISTFFISSPHLAQVQKSLNLSSIIVKPEEVGFSSERLAIIDSLLNDFVKKGIMPNAVTFISRNGKIVHNKAFGFKNIIQKQLLKKNDIFRIASQTKALTSVGLMMLYEKGKFLLDDPISMYIPEFKNPMVLININAKDTSYDARPAKSPITIRHLLTHTSGISYGNILYLKAKIPSINSRAQVTIGEVVKRLAKLPLDHDPGEKFTYGLNTDVLGYLIEIISGMPLNIYFRTQIFEPLGMEDSYFYLPKSKVNRLVTLYSKDSLQSSLYESNNVENQSYPITGAQTYFSGGAGIVGTIEDYARFCTMLIQGGYFNGKQILGRKTIDLMTINQIGDLEVWETGNKFGLGFEIVSEKGIIKFPGTIGAYRWGGAYSTDYTIDPKENLIMIIYTNVLPFANPDINNRFKILVYQALETQNINVSHK